MINEYALNNLSREDMVPTVEADCRINFEDVTLALTKEFQMLEPYGISNPVPVFVMSGLTVNELSGVSDSKHTKLVLGNGKNTLSAMYFSNSPASLGIYVGDTVDILFNIDINEWNGRESVQLIIRDIKTSKAQQDITRREHERFLEIKGGATFTASEDVMPTRDDFAAVYKLMLSSLRSGINTLSHREIISRLATPHGERSIGYIKLKIIVMVLKELNIVTLDEVSDEVYKFNIHYTTNKTDLDRSTLLRRLRQQIARNG
jgi:single-stranded-DNA-specific exonuclease